MGLKVGDLITIRMVSASDDDKYSWNAMDLEIKGIFESGNPTVDSNRIILPMKVAQEGLSMVATLMTFIALGLLRNGSWLAVLAIPAAGWCWWVAKNEWDEKWLRNPVLLLGAIILVGITLHTVASL